MKSEQKSGVNIEQSRSLPSKIPTSKETAAITTFRNEFKISGQIGYSDYQPEAGLQRGLHFRGRHASNQSRP